MIENNWLKKEMRRLDLIQKQMNDQYNTLEKPLDPNDIKHIINADLEFAPKTGQTLKSYYEQLKVYVKFCSDKNIKTHVNGPKGAWYTHRNPMGCFACEDLNLMKTMEAVIALLASKYPDYIF